ncbi:FKBP-type peptidyl-prolyl cis-trans isomerase [Rhizosphaericola mali]|uniref:Peptidyl-prolyl cis-trans isomerase n=1 Tax=Rhizosphaericola mali TaxID=2545455 RepID=A0A5P2FXE0_9BACT|nr:FKBP-type peptidyl-prolyl cis-trans isomerase [Rhizosphaericola mali]
MSVADKLFKLKKQKAEQNEAAGKKFLAENATKEGVVSLPSGLQYLILEEGNGPKPGPTDAVTCHYHGTLIDGTVFDSSVKRGQPATFPLNRVISGWTEALQLMPTGSKWRLFLPHDLAYGNQQVSAQIGPNSTLIFDVELISIG